MSDLIGASESDSKPAIHPAGGDTMAWVDDLAKWKSLSLFTETYIDTSDPYRHVERQRPIFADAVAKATEWFKERGALFPIVFPDDAIEVRVYPRTYQVVFFFRRAIAGTAPRECGIPYMLSNDQVGWLKATNRWPTKKPPGEPVH